MKTIHFLILFLILSCGTDQGSTDTYIYTVRNESGVDIKIIGYVPFDTFIINIKSGKEYTQIYKDGLPPRGYSWNFFYGSSNGNNAADSIKVIYNNIKHKDFSINNIGDERNPIYKPNEIRTKGFFTFTMEDYENAEDCNGNCD